MQELHENGQKIKLSVVIDAPEVVLPSSPHSRDIVVGYLGLLMLSNSFHAVKTEQHSALTPIYEDYSISLTELTVYRYSRCARHSSQMTQTLVLHCAVVSIYNWDATQDKQS